MENNNNYDDEIDLLDLFRALWKKALVIILVSLLTAFLFLGGTLFLVTPTYEATASFFVNNSSFSFGSTSFSISSSELTASSSLVSNYIFILQSRTTMESIIANAGLSYNYEDLSEMITAEAVPNTAAFKVTVTSESPQESELIANTIAKILPDRIAELVDGSSVRIVDYAIVPAHRAGPSYGVNMILGLLAGMLISGVIVAAKYLLAKQGDEMIHSAEELKRLYPKYTMLSLIPDMRLSEKKGYYAYYSKEGK